MIISFLFCPEASSFLGKTKLPKPATHWLNVAAGYVSPRRAFCNWLFLFQLEFSANISKSKQFTFFKKSEFLTSPKKLKCWQWWSDAPLITPAGPGLLQHGTPTLGSTTTACCPPNPEDVTTHHMVLLRVSC